VVEAAKDEGSSRRTDSSRSGASTEGAEATPVPPVAEGPSKRPSGPRAGFWVRFDALLIDLVLLAAVTGTFLGIGSSSLSSWVKDSVDPPALLLLLAYFTFFEGSASGQTVGKKALGIRVIDFRSGGPIGYGHAFIRYVGRIVSTIVILIGYLWMLWDKEKQTWHDKFAGSVVVPESAYPVEKWP
jgi:uncharacterized RDD family membrane protein YckC